MEYFISKYAQDLETYEVYDELNKRYNELLIAKEDAVRTLQSCNI